MARIMCHSPQLRREGIRASGPDHELSVDCGVVVGGALDHDQSEMIRNVLDFKHLTAKEVMVPRRRISAIGRSNGCTSQ